jgi:hypothetical protein
MLVDGVDQKVLFSTLPDILYRFSSSISEANGAI